MDNTKQPYIPIVLSGCALVMLSFGYRAGFGLFLEPMSLDLAWGRDILGLAFAIQNLTWGVFAIIAGAFADKFGNLRVLIAGVICYGAGMWGMAFSTNEATIYSTAGLLVGAGIAGTSFGIVLPALVRAVPKEKQGWALGIGTAAGSFGQFLLVPIIQLIIDLLGWFQTLQLLGLSTIIMLFFVLPIAKHGRVPTKKIEINPPLPLLTVARNAFKVPSYVLLVFGFYVCGFHLAFIGVHMPAYLLDQGFSAYIGAASISIIGLCNIFGAYYAGITSDTYPKHRILVLIYIARAIAIACFLIVPTNVFSIVIFSAVMGFLWLATVPPTSGLVATFFGTRYMTFLYGIVFFSHQLGSFTGVWLGGWLYENFGTYDGVWVAGIILGLTAAVLHFYISEDDFSHKMQATEAIVG